MVGFPCLKARAEVNCCGLEFRLYFSELAFKCCYPIANAFFVFLTLAKTDGSKP
jgi:hypothetical protein